MPLIRPNLKVYLSLFLLFASIAAAADEARKPVAQAKGATLPKRGIQTPGVQIPFSTIRAEAEFPGTPAWLTITDGVLLPAAAGDALTKIDTKTNKVGDPLPGLEKPCSGAVTAFKSLWVPNCSSGTVARMDPKTGKIDKTLAFGAAGVKGGIAASADSIWMLTDGKTTLTRIDPETNLVAGEVRIPAGCDHLLFAEGALWTTCVAENRVLRINPATNLVEQRIEVAANPVSIVAGEGSLWVLGLKDGKVDRIDPKTNKVAKTIDLLAPDNAIGSLAFGEGSLWVTLPGFPLTRIDPTAEKEKIVQQFWGEGGGALYTGAGSVWMVNEKQNALWRLDPKRIAATLAE